MSPSPSYSTNQASHHGLAFSFDVVATDLHSQFWAEHGGLEINFPVDTPATIKLRGRAHTLPSGIGMVYNGREPHAEIFDGDGHEHAIVLPPSFVDGILADCNITSNEIVFDNPRIDSAEIISPVFDELFRWRDLPEPTVWTIDCLATELVLRLITTHTNSASPRLNLLRARGYFPSCVSRAKRVIHDHLDDPEFSLDELARESRISKFHLVRSFRKAMNLTPMKYRNQLRIDRAKGSLLRDQRSIISVAMKVGFEDLSTFNKAFKRYSAGRTPSQFRALAAPVKTAGYSKQTRHPRPQQTPSSAATSPHAGSSRRDS